tara:strand:+ start:1632 stop:2021 length:390 start_codon:yes stop_codon:yes gene_type:complete
MASNNTKKTITKSGRVVKSPKNEYTDREYVAGSGFVGADQYDREFDGNSVEMHTDKVFSYTTDNYNYKDGFIVKEDDDKEENPCVADENDEESVGNETDSDEEEDEWSEYSDSDEDDGSDESDEDSDYN